MRLIDADELKKSVLDLPDCYNGFSDTYDKACILDVIDEQPTIKQPTGHWIQGHSGNLVTLKCDQCNYTSVYKEKPIWKPNYCENCGALMVTE